MKEQVFMCAAARHFKQAVLFALIFSTGALSLFAAENVMEIKKNQTSLSRDVFDQNIYYEGTQYLRFDRIYRGLFRKKARAKNVNIYDEVPDSSFFTNRHARTALSSQELTRGYQENQGPDLSGNLTVSRGKLDGKDPGFFVKDAKGEEYLIKFDPSDYVGLETASEIVGARFYYALGYNVPQETVIAFDGKKLLAGEGVKVYDSTGFSKSLTQEKLNEFMLFIPSMEDGLFRASASKVIEGELKGGFSFQGRRTKDPEDIFDHETRREIRALRVFSSWLNNYDVRSDNTMDAVVEENGRQVVKHYLLDFNASLGTGSHNAKLPLHGYEYLFDYGQVLKAILGVGLWEKPWQKLWREAGEKDDPAVGYFNNQDFDPKAFKTQLPHYAFKDLTRADGFWAAKTMMKFSNEDIASLVKAGEYLNPESTKKITDLLIERRDIIAKYWFSQAAPLDDFDVKGDALVFEDLAVKYGFEKQENTTYSAEILGLQGNRRKRISQFNFSGPSLKLDEAWFQSYPEIEILIRVSRGGSQPSPYVWVELKDKSVTGILHQD